MMNTERIIVNGILLLIVAAGVLGSVFPIISTIGTIAGLAGFVVIFWALIQQAIHEFHDHHNRRHREAGHVSDTRNP